MENILKISNRGIAVILTFCMLLGVAGTCLNVTAIAAETTATTDETTSVVAEEEITIDTEESTAVIEETTVTTEAAVPELMPMMARGCGYNYDYDTVADCMNDISSTYGFGFSPSGNGYTCSGNYSVSINNSHNYLNVILSYNGSCIAIYTCGRR